MKKYNDDQLRTAVKNAKNFSHLCELLGYKKRPGNFNSIKINIERLNLDTSHFVTYSLGRGDKKKYEKEDVFCKDSKVSYSTAKAWVLRHKLLEEKCDECGLKNEWQKKTLVLHLDHINGDKQDHRLENLRFLCPNCHSQTSTYCGRNIARSVKVGKTCVDCQIEIDKKAIRCVKCHNKKQEKIDWPKDEDLLDMLKDSSYLAVSRKLGVSDNAIRKRLRNRKLI